MKVPGGFKNNSVGLVQKNVNSVTTAPPQLGQGLFLPSLLDGWLVGSEMAMISPQCPHQAQAEKYMLPQL